MGARMSGLVAGIALGVSFATPAAAAVGSSDTSPYARYVRARAADAAGSTEAAARGYAAVLATSPEDPVLALRTFRQAIAAGDRPLATRTARLLDAAKLLPADGRLLLLVDAVLGRDWKGASGAADRIEAENVYGFTVPVIRAWIAQASGTGDPMAALDTARRGGAIAIAYAAEHRVLIALASGRTAEALTAIRAQAGPRGGADPRVRLAAAAVLVKAGDRSGALTMLEGPDPTLVAARQIVTGGRSLPGAIDGAPAGLAALFARLATDINRERVTPVSLTLARLATFLAPGDARAWLVTAEILRAAEHYDAALAAVAEVRGEDPSAGAARLARMQLLIQRGDTTTALTEAMAVAKARGATAEDWVRVGQIQSDLGHHAEAAEAFGRALALEATSGRNDERWSLLLLRGGALERSGDWPRAKATLEEALKLAPDQPAVLNYLGYAQLSRRIDLPAARRLIERASRLRPDDAAITDSLGWTYYLSGDVPKAITTLENAATAEPGDPTINEHLGDAYWTSGRRYEARFAWRAALVFAETTDAARLRRKIDQGWSPELASP